MIGISPQRALELVVLQNVVLAALTVGLFWAGVFVARRLGRRPGYSLAPLGIARPKGGIFAGVGIGLLVGFGALMASIPINLASTAILERLGYPTDRTVQGPFMDGLRGWVEQSPALAIPVMVLVIVVLGPAVEELVFRGAIFNGLYRLGKLASAGSGSKRFVGVVDKAAFVTAVLASSAVFALLHFEPVLLPALLLLAVVLCVVFRRTGSLLAPFVAHATFNSFATLLIILSGLGVFEMPVQ